MNRKVNTSIIPAGQPVTIAGPGKYFKVVRVTPPVALIVASDNNQTNGAVQGVEIEFNNPATNAVLTAPLANVATTVQYYFGTFPFIEAPKVEPNGTLTTVDWITVPANGGILCNGTMKIRGTTYRRKSFTVVNMTGLAGMNAANLALVTGVNTATAGTSPGLTPLGANFSAVNNGEYPLLPATATQVFPFTQETDDNLVLSPNALVGAIDFSIVQTWLPVIT